jgi:hypothetical protein
MDTLEIIVIASATIAGPVLAVQAQKWIERATERRRSRRGIFHALMANRATRMSDDFVRALNLIDLEFTPRRFRRARDRAVIHAWRTLFGEFSAAATITGEVDTKAWLQRIDDRLVALLSAMAMALGYEFSEEELRRGIYYPRGRAEAEVAQLAVLHGVRELLEGRQSLPIKITEVSASPELTTAQLALAQRSANAYDTDGALRVRMLNAEPSSRRRGGGSERT